MEVSRVASTFMHKKCWFNLWVVWFSVVSWGNFSACWKAMFIFLDRK